MTEVELMARLFIAVGLGMLMGLEREMARKIAGLRTHALVSLGACLFTVLAVYNFPTDSARIVAAVVAGIGFIGAGSIIATKDNIKGVTTAASLWVTAAVGTLIGVGSYLLGITTAFLVLLILASRVFER